MARYDIQKELKDICSRMYGTNFEQDRIIIEDSLKELEELKAIREYVEPLKSFYTHNLYLERLKELVK